ncbi:UNVERIFIED_CONTAM: Calcium uptake protein, mitochondrial [Sesamum radiatum]|uniref:Calcium uptake protein, mitochondrial n=1 Tax=Sesamum radiatum TaxID=300843 RepID=A0AAW2KYY5_SESRA
MIRSSASGNDREIDRDEFKKVMNLMRAHNRQGAVHSDGLRAGHKLGGSIENGGLLEYFFGGGGKKLLHHDKFVQFLRDLHDEVCGISLTDNVLDIIFHVFDANRDGSLSSDEFVRVLHKRERDIAQPTEAGVLSFLSCCWHCSSAHSLTRLLS